MIQKPDNEPHAGRERVVEVAREAMAASRHEVEEFQLYLVESEIEAGTGGWIVPVNTHASSFSSYRLNNALDHIQERIEDRLKEPVVVILDIPAGD